MSVVVKRFENTDPRLSRHVRHDSQSWEYQFLPKDAKPKGVNTFWKGNAKPLDQLKLGSCTGNAVAQWGNTNFASKMRKLAHHGLLFNEGDAVNIYRIGTQIDDTPGQYPPDDTGCDGLSVAKAAVSLGYLDKYSHIFSYSSFQAAIEMTPVIVGTVWTNDMFTCNNGLVTVGSLADSNIAGGHEYLNCGIDWFNQVFIFRQSWGDKDKWHGCKKGGYFSIGFSDVYRLLDAQGDVTVLHGVGLK